MGGGFIAVALPGAPFPRQRAECDLRDVQPAPVLGREVEFEARPDPRNNFVLLSLLKHSTESGLHDIADALYKDAPENPGVVATYAFSLHFRGKLPGALAAMRKLQPEQLREPTVARYHGIFLSAAGRGGEAVEYLALGEKGFLLPEEKVLIRKVKGAAPDAAEK